MSTTYTLINYNKHFCLTSNSNQSITYNESGSGQVQQYGNHGMFANKVN